MKITEERLLLYIKISAQIITCYQELIVYEVECKETGLKCKDSPALMSTLEKLRKLLLEEQSLYDWFMLNPAAAIELESLYQTKLGDISHELIMDLNNDNIKNLTIRRIQEKLAEFNNKRNKNRQNEISSYIGEEFEMLLIKDIEEFSSAGTADNNNDLMKLVTAKYSYAFLTPQIESWLIKLTVGQYNKSSVVNLKGSDIEIYNDYGKKKIKEYIKQLSAKSSYSKFLIYAIKAILKPLPKDKKSVLDSELADFIINDSKISEKGNAEETYAIIKEAFAPQPDESAPMNVPQRRNGAENWSRTGKIRK